MNMKQILERITLCRGEAQISERALSLAAGLSADAIRNWRRKVENGQEPGANARSIELVATALSVSREWLMTGADDGSVGSADEQSKVGRPRIFDNLRHISAYDIEASAGHGAIITDEEPIYEMGFSKELLGALTSARNEELAVIIVRGDSMLPTLMDGDQMLVDITQRNTNRDGMFILRYDDVLRVKRIDVNPANLRLRVKSDNPGYESFEVNPADLDVIGRVVWVGRRV
jgi:phage repressor protein C with HTH and peptisase S24 domain